MDKGKIIEMGTHQTLMAKGEEGAYYKLRVAQDIAGAEEANAANPENNDSQGSGEGEGDAKKPSEVAIDVDAKEDEAQKQHPVSSPRERTGSQVKQEMEEAAKRKLNRDAAKGKSDSSLEYEEYKCLCCKRRRLRDPVPSCRVWRLQRPEWGYLALALLGALLAGCQMPGFALIFAEVRAWCVSGTIMLRGSLRRC